MMNPRISLMEKIGFLTIIMPYYESSHISFLLLSKLDSKTMQILNDNYEGLLNSMVEYNACLILNGVENIFRLPWDLFRYSIVFYSQKDIKDFAILIENINSKIGWYFNKHYMNNRLNIRKFCVQTYLVRALYPNFDLLKKIGDIDCIEYKHVIWFY